MRKLIIFLFIFNQIESYCQIKPENLGIQLGGVFNVSSDEFNSTTGLGIYIEPNYMVNNRIRVGLRFEPTALAYGILVLPGGCDGECKEGANFLMNSYLKAEYLLGRPAFGPNGVKYQTYVGAQIVILTHQRYIITSRIVGNWKDTRERITNVGIGPRIGLKAGRFDISASYNYTGKDFRNHFGFNIGYQLGMKAIEFKGS